MDKKIFRTIFRKRLLVTCAATAVVSLAIVMGFSANYATLVGGERVADAAFELSTPMEIIDGKGSVNPRYTSIVASRAKAVEEGVVSLDDTGILFNSDPISSIKNVSITFDADTFTSATLYYGNRLYPTANAVALGIENNVELPNDNSFFLVRAEGDDTVVTHLSVSYFCDYTYEETELPRVYIDTRDEDDKTHAINSRTDYTNAKVSIVYPDGSYKDLNPSVAGVRIRGNSTSSKPKKPYRIKFDKKQTLFGLTKSKNWALLADYMDGSKMKNYMGLEFSHLVRGEDEFTGHPHHVEVYIDDAYQGLYLLTENMDEKEGRLGLAQEDGYFTSLFDEFNNFDLDDFPIAFERDGSATTDPKSILDETYFALPLADESVIYYSLNYPEKSDFVTLNDQGKVIKDESGEAIIDEEKYFLFFDAFKAYVANIEASFGALGTNANLDDLSALADVESFASYGLVDMFMHESDHARKSAKFYKPVHGLLKAGPTWDYDSCSLGIPYEGNPVDKPNYDRGMNLARTNVGFGERWSRALYANIYGKQSFRDAWQRVTNEQRVAYADQVREEMAAVAPSVYRDSVRWYDNSSMVFNNVRYVMDWLDARFVGMNQFLG